MKYKNKSEVEPHSCVGCINKEFKMKNCIEFIRDMKNQGLSNCIFTDLIYIMDSPDIQQPNFLYDNLGERIHTN